MTRGIDVKTVGWYSRLAGWKLGEHMIVLYKCIKDICSQNKKSYLSRRII